jgi:hypothetical protein
MPSRRHSAELKGRREDLGIGVRDMATGLGIGLGRLLSMEEGKASEEEGLLSDMAQPRRRLVRRRKASPVKGRECRPPVQMTISQEHCQRPDQIYTLLASCSVALALHTADVP